MITGIIVIVIIIIIVIISIIDTNNSEETGFAKIRKRDGFNAPRRALALTTLVWVLMLIRVS